MAKRNNALSEISDEKCELQMTPMIDVTFLLLIFFMCTLKFKVLEGKLGAHLPKDVGVAVTDEPPVDKFKIQIRVVTAGDRVRWSSDSKSYVPYTGADAEQKRKYEYRNRVLEYNMGAVVTTDISRVADELKRIYSALGEETRVELDPRNDTIQKDVVDVLDLVLGAEITQVNFTGSFEN